MAHQGETLLVLDLTRPWEMYVAGKRIRLRPAEWRMIKHLAHRPRRCCSWEDLYTALWPQEVRGEPGQLYSHASRIRSKVRTALEGEELPLVTHATHGLVLELNDDQILIAGGAPTTPRPKLRGTARSPIRGFGRKSY